MTIRDMADACTTLTQYSEICREVGSDLFAEESTILAVGDKFLPEFAREVRDGGPSCVEYWAWMADQTVTAQEAHDLTIEMQTYV